jgi:hypothetical protein
MKKIWMAVRKKMGMTARKNIPLHEKLALVMGVDRL